MQPQRLGPTVNSYLTIARCNGRLLTTIIATNIVSECNSKDRITRPNGMSENRLQTVRWFEKV